MGTIYLDTEFNSYKGELISVGLVKQDGTSLYGILPPPTQIINDWVEHNVVPILHSVPDGIKAMHYSLPGFQQDLQRFLQEEKDDIVIVTDWPDDVKYFSDLLITAPGRMLDIPGIVFVVKRVDAYPTPLRGAVQHNAMWDALALRYFETGLSDYVQYV